MHSRTAVIIGAGPAGLTAAYELLKRTDIKPVIFECTGDIGGISKTVNYKGNRIDIGGHRFFSKSDRVMDWWRSMLPVQRPCERLPGSASQSVPDGPGDWHYDANGPDPNTVDEVMLIRSRKSRILYLRKLFDYPISLSLDTLSKLGFRRTAKIGASYLKARMAPIHQEKSLEDFLINRFGKELYATFFRDYTEKVWGTPCDQIKPEWGAQRIKGLSVTKALRHAAGKMLSSQPLKGNRNVETTLIEQFWYPKYGPGQLWETVARKIVAMGGELRLRHRVVGLRAEGGSIKEAQVHDVAADKRYSFAGDYFLSTMPVKDLIEGLKPAAPETVLAAARGLIYRDFITVGLLLKKLALTNDAVLNGGSNTIPDNWIYVQEPDLKVGRLQIFNNWSPYMVEDPKTIWIGHEYFCTEGDAFWNRPDAEIINLAIEELGKISAMDKSNVLDSTLIRMPKAYPAYFGSYHQFPAIRDFVNGFENLFLVGRNGMHRYNNQDHSMLTAMAAVDKIAAGITEKADIWTINTEQEYHETKESGVLQ
ncbi:MAG: NAD(P)/FAD-dependent oxidoreductase [Acidobacteriota bacterium]|nr:NAD(P)/FAD-dependent oxidoreductase [Acidobacteriota bacterium]